MFLCIRLNIHWQTIKPWASLQLHDVGKKLSCERGIARLHPYENLSGSSLNYLCPSIFCCSYRIESFLVQKREVFFESESAKVKI